MPREFFLNDQLQYEKYGTLPTIVPKPHCKRIIEKALKMTTHCMKITDSDGFFVDPVPIVHNDELQTIVKDLNPYLIFTRIRINTQNKDP